MNYVPPITTLTLNDETTLLISRSIDGVTTVTEFHPSEALQERLSPYVLQRAEEIPAHLHLSGAGYRFDPTEGGPITITLDVQKDGQTVQETIFQGIVHEISPLHSAVR